VEQLHAQLIIKDEDTNKEQDGDYLGESDGDDSDSEDSDEAGFLPSLLRQQEPPAKKAKTGDGVDVNNSDDEHEKVDPLENVFRFKCSVGSNKSDITRVILDMHVKYYDIFTVNFLTHVNLGIIWNKLETVRNTPKSDYTLSTEWASFNNVQNISTLLHCCPQTQDDVLVATVIMSTIVYVLSTLATEQSNGVPLTSLYKTAIQELSQTVMYFKPYMDNAAQYKTHAKKAIDSSLQVRNHDFNAIVDTPLSAEEVDDPTHTKHSKTEHRQLEQDNTSIKRPLEGGDDPRQTKVVKQSP
jgi:hypothetical protein